MTNLKLIRNASGLLVLVHSPAQPASSLVVERCGALTGGLPLPDSPSAALVVMTKAGRFTLWDRDWCLTITTPSGEQRTYRDRTQTGLDGDVELRVDAAGDLAVGPYVAPEDMVRFSWWASPLDGFPGDHTWVSAEDGFCNPALGGGAGHYCRGDEKAKRLLGTAFGDPRKARAVAARKGLFHERRLSSGGSAPTPKYSGVAGISYAVNGLCHQISNRLLLTTGSVIEGARGHRDAALLYGYWGEWSWLAVVNVAAFVEFERMRNALELPRPNWPRERAAPNDEPRALAAEEVGADLGLAMTASWGELTDAELTRAEEDVESRHLAWVSSTLSRQAPAWGDAKLARVVAAVTDVGMAAKREAAPCVTSVRALSPALDAPDSRRALLDLANGSANSLRHSLAGLLDAREFEAFYGEPPGSVIRFG